MHSTQHGVQHMVYSVQSTLHGGFIYISVGALRGHSGRGGSSQRWSVVEEGRGVASVPPSLIGDRVFQGSPPSPATGTDRLVDEGGSEC